MIWKKMSQKTNQFQFPQTKANQQMQITSGKSQLNNYLKTVIVAKIFPHNPSLHNHSFE